MICLIIAAQKLKEMATERLTKAHDMIKQIRSEVLIDDNSIIIRKKQLRKN